jgi:hypothetical protein
MFRPGRTDYPMDELATRADVGLRGVMTMGYPFLKPRI